MDNLTHEKKYFKNGDLKMEIKYNDSYDPISYKKYDKKGNVIEERVYEDGDTRLRYEHREMMTTFSFQLKDGTNMSIDAYDHTLFKWKVELMSDESSLEEDDEKSGFFEHNGYIFDISDITELFDLEDDPEWEFYSESCDFSDIWVEEDEKECIEKFEKEKASLKPITSKDQFEATMDN